MKKNQAQSGRNMVLSVTLSEMWKQALYQQTAEDKTMKTQDTCTHRLMGSQIVEQKFGGKNTTLKIIHPVPYHFQTR